MTPQMASFGGTASLPLHLVEEINHRVANEYTEAIATLSLAAADLRSAEAGIALRRAADCLRAHAETHRALLPPLDGLVNLADYVGRLCESLSHASLADRGVRLTIATDEIWLTSQRAWRIGLVIAELVRNAARHGLRGRGGVIAVCLRVQGGDILCGIRDNGRHAAGMRPGRGVALVRSLAAELCGSAEWRFTDAGCTAQLRVPAEIRGT